MDPVQAIALRQVTLSRKPATEQIDAFYNDNAFDTLHSIRRSRGQLFRLLSAIPVRLRSLVQQSPKFVRTPKRA